MSRGVRRNLSLSLSLSELVVGPDVSSSRVLTAPLSLSELTRLVDEKRPELRAPIPGSDSGYSYPCGLRAGTLGLAGVECVGGNGINVWIFVIAPFRSLSTIVD